MPYMPQDFAVGCDIAILCRQFRIYDMDQYSREFYDVSYCRLIGQNGYIFVTVQPFYELDQSCVKSQLDYRGSDMNHSTQFKFSERYLSMIPFCYTLCIETRL